MTGERRFYETPVEGALRSAPATTRNREPISDVLSEWLPASGMVLELASGTGEHAIHFGRRFPELEWQPSDVHPEALESIRSWRRTSGLANVREPIAIDAAAIDWPIGSAAAILSINMVHISPWSAALGLLAGAARILPKGGPLILYGPWLKDDIPTAPSNLEFDADLKRRDSEWGLRRVEEFVAAAKPHGLELTEIRSMPANNLMLLLRRTHADVNEVLLRLR